MRDIKFRAWSKGRMWQSATNLAKWNENAVLIQYTGLKDKNGVEIYEGDVVKIDGSRPIWVVGYKAPKFITTVSSGGVRAELYSDLIYEVIGNIYENPELLDNHPEEEAT